ncbi:MAG: cation transporter [Candidatus Odinarchaeota archaeon]|nr:cation transporter [Candidatus Odinarchaeota archaeon]
MSKHSLMTLLKLSIVSYFISSFIKVYGGLVSGILALVADGLDSLINVLSSSFAYFSYILSYKPPDEDHPYGHQGYEVLSVIVTNFVMISMGSIVFILSFLRINIEYSVGEIGIYFALISTIIIIAAMISMYLLSKKTQSVSLKAEFRHLAVDSLESLLVLGSVSLAIYYSYIFDIFAALLIGILMFVGAVKNTTEIYESIVYKIPSKELIDKIKNIVESHKEVRECHKIRIRCLGRYIFVDMHVLVDKTTPISIAHALADHLENEIKEKIKNVTDVVIHLEPFNDKSR